MIATEVWTFPRRGSVLQPRVAVLGYPGTSIGVDSNPNGVVAVMINDERWRGSVMATSGRNPFRVAINTDTVPTWLHHPG
jgi:hypothetical protein